MEALLQTLPYALLAAATMAVGGILTAYVQPSRWMRSAILHFAAGVIFSVVGVELLPDITSRHDPWSVVIGFGLGIVTMLLIRRGTKPGDAARATGPGALPTGLLWVVGVDLVVDGLLMGIGFSSGAETGALLAVALSIEILSLGLATGASLRKAGVVRRSQVLTSLGLAGVLLVSAGLGAWLLEDLPDQPHEIILSFGLAALLFLVTEELLTEAHEKEDTLLLTTAFFAGFLLFLLLGMQT
ncbi:zinc transporter, ZIP family [Catalinimonas alkaloidigena]|uniref:Zinc transporter, ZIP family n=1 Tax=Catalinimonas alkaloidigena TaxID=1075417 RepID=A0A1G9VND1_9BACT|nr:hypothetical protein [Catalinimonas alkaloidigena]SDM73714.1 zinc transporter, ZIP family [Catalinimonas alkaloidigena]